MTEPSLHLTPRKPTPLSLPKMSISPPLSSALHNPPPPAPRADSFMPSSNYSYHLAVASYHPLPSSRCHVNVAHLMSPVDLTTDQPSPPTTSNRQSCLTLPADVSAQSNYCSRPDFSDLCMLPEDLSVTPANYLVCSAREKNPELQ